MWGILSSPLCPAVEAQSLNHWTARDVPSNFTFLRKLDFLKKIQQIKNIQIKKVLLGCRERYFA